MVHIVVSSVSPVSHCLKCLPFWSGNLVTTCCWIPGSYVVTLRSRVSHGSWMGLTKSRHPMRNSRLLFLVRLSFTTSTKCCGFSLTVLDGVVTCAPRCTRFSTCGVLTTHFPPVDLDFSQISHPHHPSEVVLAFLPFTPSPVSYSHVHGCPL